MSDITIPQKPQLPWGRAAEGSYIWVMNLLPFLKSPLGCKKSGVINSIRYDTLKQMFTKDDIEFRYEVDGDRVSFVAGDWTYRGCFRFITRYSKFTLHSFDDIPAIECSKEQIYGWYTMGRLDRRDGPAVVTPRLEMYARGGVYHRDDGPAVLDGDARYWYQHGRLHRDGGPAYVSPEKKVWMFHGQLAMGKCKESFDVITTKTLEYVGGEVVARYKTEDKSIK